MTPFDYARLGYPVFPCRGKQPAVDKGLNWQDVATVDTETIKRWFLRPGLNVGLAVPEGVVVLDVDDKVVAANLWRDLQLGPFPDKLARQATGGGGMHLVYRLPKGVAHGNARGKLPTGIDVRGKGGYIVVEPSIHPASNTPYRWLTPLLRPEKLPVLPKPLLTLIKGGRPVVKKKQLPADLDQRLRRACMRVINAAPGTRNEVLNRSVFAYIAAGGEPSKKALDMFARAAFEVGLDEREIEATIDSAVTAAEGIAYNKDGHIKSCDPNLLAIFRRHPDFLGVWGYDTRETRPMLMAPSPIDPKRPCEFPRPLEEDDIHRLVEWLSYACGIVGTVANVSKLLPGLYMDLDYSQHYDPFVQWLESLPPWDGVDRLDFLFHDYCGVEDTRFNRAVGRVLFISAVARAMHPGCKVDTMVVLQGTEGTFKSTFLRRLLPHDNFFSDQVSGVSSKDDKALLHGPVFVEWQELDGLSKKEESAVRAFLSSQVDRYRPPYGMAPRNFPRTSVCVGTVNPSNFLIDTEGNRRILVVAIPSRRVDLEGVSAVRGLLWAEALERYQMGEHWWLPPDLVEDQKVINDLHQRDEYWLDEIENFLRQPNRLTVTVSEVLNECLAIPLDKRHHGHTIQVGKILARLGWTKKQVRSGPSKGSRIYTPPENWEWTDIADLPKNFYN